MKKLDIKALLAAIEERDMSVEMLAEKTGISVSVLKRRLKEESEFRASEIYRISDALGLSDERKTEIFFGTKVD